MVNGCPSRRFPATQANSASTLSPLNSLQTIWRGGEQVCRLQVKLPGHLKGVVQRAHVRVDRAKTWLARAIDVGDKEVTLCALDDPDLEPLWAGIGEI